MSSGFVGGMMRSRRVFSTAVALLISALPAFAQDMTRFSPTPQVSVSIPKGWALCDEAKGEKHGNAVDAAWLAQMTCEGGTPNASFLLVNSDRTHPAEVVIVAQPMAEFTRASLDSLTPKELPGIDQALCDEAGEFLLFKPDSCEASLGEFADHAVLLAHATGPLNSNPSRVDASVVELTYNGGFLIVMSRQSALQPRNSAIDEIIDSIEID